jgi:uncharacterized protein (TIGR02996 family)
MTDDGFLQAILVDPDDDAVRLIYADCLEERGDPRGEFIRVQCELARGPTGRQRTRLENREQELIRQHEKEWVQPIRSLANGWTFRRGFIDRVRVIGEKVLPGIDELFLRAPVRHLQLCWKWEFSSSMKRTHLAAALGGCPHLKRLLSLDLSRTRLDSSGVQALSVSEHLGGLTALHLSSNAIGDGGARALADSPLLPRLVHLDLSQNQIGPGGLRALAAALTAHGESVQLHTVNLRGNPLGSAGVGAIRGSPVLKRVARW